MKIQHLLGILITTSLILGHGSIPLAMAQAPAGSHLQLLSSDSQAVVLELTVDDFQVETVEHAGQTYHRLTIPDTTQTATPGEPQVPTRGTLLGLPSTQGVSVQVLDADYETQNGYRLYPAPGLEVIGANVDELPAEGARQTFVLNQERYATNAFYPSTPAEIAHTGHLRDQAVAQVQFYPVQYNPVTGEVRLYRRILARITWGIPLSAAAAETPRGASPAYENVLKSTILNYDALQRPPVIDQPPPPPMGALDIVAASVTPTLKIGVTEDGLYQLDPTDLTGAGFDLSGVSLSTIKMKNRGAEIPIYVHDNDSNDAFNGTDYILFYGTAITDMYTTKNVYWLEAGGDPGQRTSSRDGTPSGATVPTDFPATLHAEEDTSYWQFMPGGEGQDHWFWGNRLSAPTSRDYNLTLNNISTSTATVRVRLKGYTTPNHRTKIHLNGHEIDDQTWSGQIIYDHEVTTGHLISGTNAINVEAVNIGLNQFFVNWIEIDYWDQYVAENDQLLFGAPSAGPFQFEVTGFSGNVVDVFDVTDPANVAVIANATVAADGGSYKLQFQDTAQTETRYLALTPAQRKSPASIELDQPSSWQSASNGADYILITHEDFYTGTLALASHRSASGLRVATVKVGDIYDEFNYGIFNPQAIRDFLSYAYEEWVDPPPTYVLLVGDASYDYKDNLHTGMVNYVPSQIIDDSFGQTVSDNWFALVDGPDILPDMFIGRLTAQTASQATDMVDKIIHYEQDPPSNYSWSNRALLVADDGSASDFYTDAFEITSEHLADRLPFYYTASKVYVRYYPPGDPTTDITNRINGGRLLVNYAGHGNVDTWGAWTGGTIFARYHVTTLSNTNRLPVVTLADCLNGYFVGTTTSMAEEFLRLSNRRAVAIWASTSLGYPSDHRALLDSFYEAIFQDDVYALGAATTAAKIQNSSLEESVETFVLFGDPATPLGLPTNYPYVESTTPADGATSVPLDQVIQIVFSKPMNPATVVLSGPGTAGLALTPSWSDNNTVLNYTHTGFGYNETRTFTINGQDNLGNPLGTGPVPSTWSFTTPAAPNAVTISGPQTGAAQVGHTFNAAVSPISAMQPITYVWQATNQSQVTHTGGGLNDTVNFTWSVTGTQAITVTAMNALGTVTDTHVIAIENSQGSVFLPMIIKND